MSEVCVAFGIEVDGVVFGESSASQKSQLSDPGDSSMAARLLAHKSPEELEALFKFFGYKEDGESPLPS